MSTTVTISIVTYNNEKHIGNLLQSIYDNVQDIDYHIYLIDNGSTDKTLAIAEELSQDNLTIIKNKTNLGFGGGHNTVLDRLDSVYHLVINPDIILRDNVIKRMADFLNENTNKDIVLLTPKVLYPDGQLQELPKRNPRYIYLISRRISLPFLRKYRNRYTMADADPESALDIEFATGAFMFMRTAAYKQAGGFDPRYFLYFEDADLTRELRRLGRTQYNPAFIVCHHWERAGSRKLKYFFIQIVSMFRYMHKWRGKKA